MKMRVTCLNKIPVGDNRYEAVFGFSGVYDVDVDAVNFGEAADAVAADGHIPTVVMSPTGNFVSVPMTDAIFMAALPSSEWPPELRSAH